MIAIFRLVGASLLKVALFDGTACVLVGVVAAEGMGRVLLDARAVLVSVVVIIN